MPSAITISDQDVLLAIDLQADFMPGGALAVEDGDAIVPLINALARRFANVVVTQDWHPLGHASFASFHEGAAPFETRRLAYGEQTLWPDHCVQGTAGAELHPDLALDLAFLILRKGMHPGVDSYSAFVEADGKTTTGLAALLESARDQAHLRLRPRDRLLRGLFRPRCARRRVRDIRHRGRLPGDRRERFA